MAKNITLMGASYSDVPAVNLPQTGGGTARFDDCSVVTAVASDVAQGKIFVASDGTVTTGTASGGGGGADLPIFTVTWDSTWTTKTATCNESFSECFQRFYNGENGAFVDIHVDGDSEYVEHTVATTIDGQGNDYIVYSVTNAYGFVYDLIYRANGTVDIVDPSAYSAELNATANGDYWPNNIYNHVVVNVPQPSGSINITQNGTVDVTNYASAVVNVSGGGGASNIVTGTFKGTTEGVILNIDLPYTGNGYPLCVVVAPTAGLMGDTTFYNTVSRYAIGIVSIYKTYTDTVPTYASSGTQNQCTVNTMYKSSASSATSFGRQSSNDAVIFYGTSASPSGSAQSVLFENATRMCVRIKGTSYGFMKDIEYTYYVIYSE